MRLLFIFIRVLIKSNASVKLNNSMFTSTEFQSCLSHMNVKSVRTSYRAPWQNGICERAIGIFKRDLIDHIIPFNERHLRRLLRSYVVKYYNTNRTHQGIDKKTPIPKKKPIATLAKHTNLKATPVLNGLYHTSIFYRPVVNQYGIHISLAPPFKCFLSKYKLHHILKHLDHMKGIYHKPTENNKKDFKALFTYFRRLYYSLVNSSSVESIYY